MEELAKDRPHDGEVSAPTPPLILGQSTPPARS